MTVISVGLDIGKTSFSLVGLGEDRHIVFKKTLGRQDLFKYFERLRTQGPCGPIAMEACVSAYWLAEKLIDMGFEVRLLHARYVKPFTMGGQKNDERDALAIAKASLDPTIRSVPVQDAEQRAILNLHRSRERLVKHRTALVNQMRAMLWEEGLTPRTGRLWFEKNVTGFLAANEGILDPTTYSLLLAMAVELKGSAGTIEGLNTEIEGIAITNPMAQRLMSIPGIGPLNATAIAAQVGDPDRFASGRDMAAWLGLVPRQISTGGNQTLRGITRAGNNYLRKLLIHGARSLMMVGRGKSCLQAQWARGLVDRGVNRAKASVALANKLARLCWAVMAKETYYTPGPVAAA